MDKKKSYKKTIASAILATTLLGAVGGLSVLANEASPQMASAGTVAESTGLGAVEKEVNAFFKDNSFNQISDVYQQLIDNGFNDPEDKAGTDWSKAYDNVMNLPNTPEKEILRKRIIRVLYLYSQQVKEKRYAEQQQQIKKQYALAEIAVRQLFSDDSCTKFSDVPANDLNDLFDVAWKLVEALPSSNQKQALKTSLYKALSLYNEKVKQLREVEEKEEYKLQYYDPAEAMVKELFSDDSCTQLATVDKSELGKLYGSALQAVEKLPQNSDYQKQMKKQLDNMLDAVFKLAIKLK